MANSSTLLGRKSAWGHRSCGCCYRGDDKRGWKRAERREWQQDANDEMNESSAHEPSVYDVLNEDDVW